MTLSRYILVEQRKHKEAHGDLTLILMAIQTACKAITAAVRRAGLTGLYGLHGATNSTGDDQKKLDVIANDIFINSLRHTGLISVMVSEENEEPVMITDHADAKYTAVFDPLDGSSNIDCNVSVGSIFGIYRRLSGAGSAPNVADVLQPGTSLVCAGYAMYGSSTELVITLGEGVQMFSLDPSIGEFIQTRASVRIPANPQRVSRAFGAACSIDSSWTFGCLGVCGGMPHCIAAIYYGSQIYSVNEGNYAAFPKGVRTFIDDCKKGEKPYSLRYVGSMVRCVGGTGNGCVQYAAPHIILDWKSCGHMKYM